MFAAKRTSFQYRAGCYTTPRDKPKGGNRLPAALVETVEDSLPCRLLSLHHLPVLAHGPILLWCPCYPVPDGGISLRVRALALENHAPADKSPIKFERSAAVVNPSLVPSVPTAIVEVNAPTATAVDRAP